MILGGDGGQAGGNTDRGHQVPAMAINFIQEVNREAIIVF